MEEGFPHSCGNEVIMAVNTVREDETLKTAGKTVTLLRLFRYLLSYRKMIAFVIFIMLLTVGISLINPLIIERAINVNIKNNDIEGLLKLGAEIGRAHV